MLGITTPDAIAIGTLILACLAAYRGSTAGTTAKTEAIKAAPFVSIAGSIVEANQFSDFMKVLDKGAIAMTELAAAIRLSHEVKHTNALEALAEKVDEVLEQRPARRR